MGRRDGTLVRVYMRAHGDLARARGPVEVEARRYGVISGRRARQLANGDGLRIETGQQQHELADLLGTGGTASWLWPRRDVRTR